jgi:hypothetical protein
MTVTDPEVIDGTAIEVREPTSLALVPTVKAGELVERLDVIREAMVTAMKPDIDYGHIPGTDKPALLKPGAEKLGVLFQLDLQLENEKVWGPGDHLTVMSRATVFHAPSGSRLGFGEGLCSTREKKYAYRTAERTCPGCGKPNLRKSKNTPEWYCWAKTDGCGATFPLDDERISSQQAGQVDNPDLPDLWNTVVKMAEKRARVDAVLAVTGASALFTQDIEPPDDPPPPDEPPPVVTATPPKSTEKPATAAQRRLVNAKAGEANLTSQTLANILLVAGGAQPKAQLTDQQADDGVKRLLDRLPGRLVDAVLEAIQVAAGDVEF